ncbi:MAG: amidohydrolase [Sphaerochaeta sp.]|jgi:5-methylthioadenosine/S-adenosylhomocysteine deaminase|nr:amidohydrolase [Sphaerochaeta sp.]MCI2097260.1 amidohydrolase [Sphaerochaeta sp.]MCI2104466.1 amidohydrolase [Sphaerochaeta sp.]
MNTLITNALVIPMTKEGYTIQGNIGINGKEIVFVGQTPASFHPDRVIDANGSIVMPALVNAHTHLAMELMRNYKDTEPNLMAWLSQIWPIEAKLNDEDILWASRLGVCELIQSGCTLFNDMYFNEHMTARAANEGGIRASIGLTLFGDIDDTRKRLAEKPKNCAPEVEKSNGRIKLAVAPHAIYTCTEVTYRYAHDWAKEHAAVLHTHLSETKGEVDDCVKAHGQTPLDYLDGMGYFDDTKHLLAHCVHLTDSEISRLSQFDAAVATNPTSNCKLASGVAPLGKLGKAGVKLCIGTDGSSSNNNQNLFEEMHVASLVSTVSTMDITSLPPYRVLEMATKNGADALGFPQIGTIQPGKEADLIIVDIHKPHLTPLNDPFSALVYAAQASDVDTVFCQGEMVMEHRHILGLDLEETMRKTNERWEDIKRR